MTVMISLNLNDETTIFRDLHLGLNQPDTMTHAATDEHLSEWLCLRAAIKTQNFIGILTSTSQNDIRIAHAKHNSLLFSILHEYRS